MKGQFFLIGAVIVCMMLYAASAPLVNVQGGPDQDISALSENMEKEMPRALNIGINASDPAGTLISFANFSRSAAVSRGMDLSVVFVIFESTGSGTVATAGNAAAGQAIIGIDVDGTYAELSVPAGSVNSTQFPAAGDTFDFSVTAGGLTTDATMPGGKTGLFAISTISRGGVVLRKEILA